MTQAAAPKHVHRAIEQIMRDDRGRLVAALSASLNDFTLAEDSLQEALQSALSDWAQHGIPKSPQGWLLTVAKRKAIDVLRRGASFSKKSYKIKILQEELTSEIPADIPDVRLRLMFTCCHPALEPAAQVALTLHSIGGLTTGEIARCYLVKTATMAARLTRAKTKIKGAGIPFADPELDDLPDRFDSILQVIYLIYNEGYSATQGVQQIRVDLCEEALYLARLMTQLAPNMPEAEGLLALILFSHARRDARYSATGDYITLGDQDRKLWDQAMIAQADAIIETALKKGRLGAYQLQAAIHGLHTKAASITQTDWPQITALYGLLDRVSPSDVVKLNLAVATSYSVSCKQALAQLAEIGDGLAQYQPYYAAFGDVLERDGQFDAACKAYVRAIDLSQIDAERAFLADKLAKLKKRDRA